MAGIKKVSTGLTGMAVSTSPHHTLGVLYCKIMRTLEKMPESAAYRKYTQSIVEERSRIIKSTTDVAEIEKRIGCGQVEEVIIQAENELLLARKMLTWKPWEPLLKAPPKNQWTWPPIQ